MRDEILRDSRALRISFERYAMMCKWQSKRRRSRQISCGELQFEILYSETYDSVQSVIIRLTFFTADSNIVSLLRGRPSQWTCKVPTYGIPLPIKLVSFSSAKTIFYSNLWRKISLRFTLCCGDRSSSFFDITNVYCYRNWSTAHYLYILLFLIRSFNISVSIYR